MSNFGSFGDGFRFPEGVEFLGALGHEVSLSVSMPLEEDGHFGRECPECGQHFRIDNADYEALPDDLRLWCVYCGHTDDHGEFLTHQQSERLGRAAQDYGSQIIGRMLDDSFGSLARNNRNNKFVKVSYRSEPFYPQPLPAINEENLIRERTCDNCRVRYAVFGEHRFCPFCGVLPARTVALDALAADETRIRVLGDLDPSVLGTLREAGVLDRTYADTIENVVGTIEALAEKTFHDLVPLAENLVRGKGKVFQRLDSFADLYRDHAGIDIRTQLADIWPRLQATWAARHIHTHADGTVDQKYLDQVPDSSLRVGQRLRSTADDAQAAIDDARLLAEAITRPQSETA